MKWPGKKWVDDHPLAAAYIFGCIMASVVLMYFVGVGYVVFHFIDKYW